MTCIREHTVQKIADGASLKDTLARPKSHIFNLQSALARMFFGFKSRWNTFAARSVKNESTIKKGIKRQKTVSNTCLYVYILDHEEADTRKTDNAQV